MVTSESNRAQSPAMAPFERQTQVFQPAAEAAVKQPPSEQRESIFLRDPLRFMSFVVSGATIGSMWGLSAVVLAILGLSGVRPIYMLPVAGIVAGLAFLAPAKWAPTGCGCSDSRNMRLPGSGSWSTAAWRPC